VTGPQSTPWPTIIGGGVLVVLVIAVVLVLLSENATPGTTLPSGSASAAASESASAVAATASLAPSASAAPAGLQVGTFVAPIVDGVTLRETPTTSGVRIGELALGSVNLVIEGPVEAEGYGWYRLSAAGLPPSSGCITPLPTDPLTCPVWYGWAAGGDPASGEEWFEPTEVECPDPTQDTAGFLELPQRVPLGCYGTSPITFTAWRPELPGGLEQGEPCDADPAIAWIYCPESIPVVFVAPEANSSGFRRLHVDPASGVVVSEEYGEWLRITGAYDHPAAAACAEAETTFGEDPDPDLAVLECRAKFVVQGVEVTAAP
jgi:hypothetical protein